MNEIDLRRYKLESINFLVWSDWYIFSYSLLLSGVLIMGGMISYIRDTSINPLPFFGWHPIYIGIVHITLWSVKETIKARTMARPAIAATFVSFISGVIASGFTTVFVILSLTDAINDTIPEWNTHVLPVVTYIAMAILMDLLSLSYCISILIYNGDAIVSRYTQLKTRND